MGYSGPTPKTPDNSELIKRIRTLSDEKEELQKKNEELVAEKAKEKKKEVSKTNPDVGGPSLLSILFFVILSGVLVTLVGSCINSTHYRIQEIRETRQNAIKEAADSPVVKLSEILKYDGHHFKIELQCKDGSSVIRFRYLENEEYFHIDPDLTEYCTYVYPTSLYVRGYQNWLENKSKLIEKEKKK